MQVNPFIQQIKKSNNPFQSIMGVLGQNNQQMQIFNELSKYNEQEQAQKIADACNQRGISKQDLINLLNK